MAFMHECLVFRVATRHPGDTTGLSELIDSGVLRAAEILAIFGKTEGNGCVNDFTRSFAVAALQAELAPRLDCSPREVGQRVAMVMSGGTEGGLAPHMLVLATRELASATSPGAPRLAVGTAVTRAFDPSEIGRMAQVEATAGAVAEAMRKALIANVADVHFVQVKCPLLTSERVAQVHAAGGTVATHDTYKSMALSRGASALGIGLALGEVDPRRLTDACIGEDLSLWSGRASASAGIELMHNEVIVLGNSSAWGGDHVIGHSVMNDGIDLPAILGLLRSLGLETDGQLAPQASGRVTATLVKADPSRSGVIRGKRHIMWDDSDINATRHARALVGGVVGAALGTTELFVSGGAEHQGPDGGGPIAVLVNTRPVSTQLEQ